MGTNDLKYSFLVDENGKVSIQEGNAKFTKDLSNFPNTTFTATFKKARRQRTLKQNAFYFSNFLESQIECFKEMWGETYDKEQIHSWNKANIWCDEVVMGDEVFKIPQSSTEMNTVEWEQRLDLCRTFFMEKFNWTLPYPLQQSEMFIDPDAEHNKTAIVPNNEF